MKYHRINNDLPAKTALTWTQEGTKRQAENNVATNNGRTDGCWVNWAQQQGEPKTEGTEGCWVNMGHSSQESPRQRELKAAGLTWGTAARRAQDRGN